MTALFDYNENYFPSFIFSQTLESFGRFLRIYLLIRRKDSTVIVFKRWVRVQTFTKDIWKNWTEGDYRDLSNHLINQIQQQRKILASARKKEIDVIENSNAFQQWILLKREQENAVRGVDGIYVKKWVQSRWFSYKLGTVHTRESSIVLSSSLIITNMRI